MRTHTCTYVCKCLACARLCPYKLKADKPQLGGTAFEFGIHTHKSFAQAPNHTHTHTHPHTCKQKQICVNLVASYGHMCATICRPCDASELLNCAPLLFCCYFSFISFIFIFLYLFVFFFLRVDLKFRFQCEFQFRNINSARAAAPFLVQRLLHSSGSANSHMFIYVFICVCMCVCALQLLCSLYAPIFSQF